MNRKLKRPNCSHTIALGALGLACLFPLSFQASAQIVARDAATNSTYGGSFSGLNGGFGFGSWSTSTSGGGSYVGSNGGTLYFGLWNNGFGPGTGSFATRTFNAALSAGQAFSTSFKTGNLNSSLEQEGFNLEDSAGNILFSYWQQGGNNANGNYVDANGAGTATGFAYNFNTLGAFVFTLNSASTYTITDIATAASFSGAISGTIDRVQFFRQNLAGDPATGGGGGTDFRIFDLQITAVPEPSILALAGIGAVGTFVIARRRTARS